MEIWVQKQRAKLREIKKNMDSKSIKTNSGFGDIKILLLVKENHLRLEIELLFITQVHWKMVQNLIVQEIEGSHLNLL